MKKLEFELDKIMFKSKDNGFTIARVYPLNSKEVSLSISNYGNISIKGVMCDLNNDIRYECIITDEENSAYGTTYIVSGVRPLGMGSMETDEEMLIFVKAVLGKSIYNKVKEVKGICDIIKNKDVSKLLKIKGIGKKVANKIIYKWETEGLNSKFIHELLAMGFKEDHIDTISSTYEDLAYAIDRIKKNPYFLILDNTNIRIQVVDRVAVNLNINKDDDRRISAYIYKALKDESYRDFRSYINIKVFKKNKIVENIIHEVGIDKFEEILNDLIYNLYVKRIGDNIGLRSVYNNENKLLKEISRIANSRNEYDISDIDDKIDIEEDIMGIKLTNKQREAVKCCLNNNFNLIKGYAGTGKTTITRIILNILEKSKKDIIIKQCALSGKAAQVLSNATEREANTIHKLLELQGEVDKEKKKEIDTDILVIDELSMVDIGLFKKLLESVRCGVKVICMGDNNQLPSLAFGKLIDDISMIDNVGIVSLTEVHRQALESGIIVSANEIREDKFVSLRDKTYTVGNMKDMFIDTDSSEVDLKHKVIDKVVELYDKDNKDKVQVICATASLCYSFNRYIQHKLIDTTGKFITVEANGNIPKKNDEVAKYRIFEDDKIMIIRNMYGVDTRESYFGECEEDNENNLYNGNIGSLVEINDRFVVVNINDEEYVIEEDNYNNIQLAYACTCHKLQGSAAEDVIIYLSGNYAEKYLMCNEWLYTAITRSRKRCYLYGNYNDINRGVKTRNLNKKTTFMELILK